MGVIASAKRRVDPVAEILRRRFGLKSPAGWKSLLAAEYAHAVGLLAQADAVFFSGPSEWLINQNSFNQVVFLAVQEHIHTKAMPGAVTTINKLGQLVDFGVTLDPNNKFSKTYPRIADALRQVNSRRNRLPAAHPYDKKVPGSLLPTDVIEGQEGDLAQAG